MNTVLPWCSQGYGTLNTETKSVTGLLVQIFQIMLPIVTIVALGIVAGRLSTPDLTTANQLNLNYFIPALVFSSFTTIQFEFSKYALLALCGLLLVLTAAFLATLVSRFTGYAYRTVAPPLMFHNAGNIGLPLLSLAYGEQGLAIGLILFLIGNITHFALGSYLLAKKPNWISSLVQPGIIAAVAALTLQATSIKLPEFTILPFTMLGAIAVPLMLFSLGVRIATARFEHLQIGLIIGLLAPALGIVSAGIFIVIFQLDGIQAACLLLFGALPPAVMNYVFAERYDQEPAKVSSIVLYGNLMAVVILPAALFFVLPRYF